MVAFGAAVAVVGGALAAAPAAQAASTWKTHDKSCRTGTAGSACAEVQKRVTDAGAVNGYRARVTITPAEGQWMKATTHTWSSDGATHPVCAGGCPQQTSAWTSAWTPVKTTAGTYVARGETAGGFTFDAAASWSDWTRVAEKCTTHSAGKYCVYRHERGYRDVMEERGKLTVTPAAGKWIEPRQVRVGTVSDGTHTYETSDLCDPSCTRRTTSWSATVTRNIPGIGLDYDLYASAKVALPSGEVKTIKASLTD